MQKLQRQSFSYFLHETNPVNGLVIDKTAPDWPASIAATGLALAAYAMQLILNAAWTPLFFGLRRPDLGFFDVVLLWLSIVATIAFFLPIDVVAAALLVPYLAWVTFAAALNFAVWRLNAAVAPQAPR